MTILLTFVGKRKLQTHQPSMVSTKGIWEHKGTERPKIIGNDSIQWASLNENKIQMQIQMR